MDHVIVVVEHPIPESYLYPVVVIAEPQTLGNQTDPVGVVVVMAVERQSRADRRDLVVVMVFVVAVGRGAAAGFCGRTSRGVPDVVGLCAVSIPKRRKRHLDDFQHHAERRDLGIDDEEPDFTAPSRKEDPHPVGQD